jgi:hypothetical protein
VKVLATYPVDTSLGCLLQCVDDDFEVLAEFRADRQRYVPKHAEDLRLHRPMHLLVLKGKQGGKGASGEVEGQAGR